MWRSRALLVLGFASGCHIVFPIVPGSDASADSPHVYSSPGPTGKHYPGYPGPVTVALAADQPGTTIYYTTDGSTPTLESLSSTTPSTLDISATTTLRYFGVNGGVRGATTSEEFVIKTTAKDVSGFVITSTTLDGISPVVVAAGGSMLAATADIHTWVQKSCPSCGAQLIYGVDNVDQGCLYADSPGDFSSGTTLTAQAFTVTVPTSPGIYVVQVGHSEQETCTDALDAHTLVDHSDTVARIGVVVVP